MLIDNNFAQQVVAYILQYVVIMAEAQQVLMDIHVETIKSHSICPVLLAEYMKFAPKISISEDTKP